MVVCDFVGVWRLGARVKEGIRKLGSGTTDVLEMGGVGAAPFPFPRGPCVGALPA